jgi:hypothetical protein
MMSKTPLDGMPDAQRAIWQRATASDYIKFDNGMVDIQFVNGQVNVGQGIGGKESYEFDVILTSDNGKEAKILGTQSKGLMDQLLALYPLAEKRVSITRTGEGFQTVYIVKEL